MWERIGGLCVAVLLACHSVSDIRRQCLPGRSLAAGVLISCGWAMGKGLLGMQSWMGLGAGMLPGFVALLLARVTREQVGRGDGWELIIMGNSMGLADCLLALGIALTGAVCAVMRNCYASRVYRGYEKNSVKTESKYSEKVFYDKIKNHRRPKIMANRKKEVYKPKPMTEGKRNVIQGLLREYDIQTAEDIQDALKDLLSGTLKEMLEVEMDGHLGYDRYERSDEPNYRNGTKPKRVRSKYGEFEVDMPQDRQSSFEPQVLPKRKKDISAIDDKIIVCIMGLKPSP